MEQQNNNKYDAFISYRHVEPDMTIAKRLHMEIEKFKPPKGLYEKGKTFRVFRDREELSTRDLSDSIQEALESAGHLIVICSKRTRESDWVTKEIETFRKLHGDKNISAVLVEGEPQDVFPLPLLDLKKEGFDEEGNPILLPLEHLAADVRPQTVKEINFPGYESLSKEDPKKYAETTKQALDLLVKTEKYRILAGMFGLSYGDLRQRDKERRLQQIMAASISAAVILLIFGLSMFGLYQKSVKAERNAREKLSLITMENAATKLEEGDPLLSLLVADQSIRLLDDKMANYDTIKDRNRRLMNDVFSMEGFYAITSIPFTTTHPRFLLTPDETGLLVEGYQNHLALVDWKTGTQLHAFEEVKGQIYSIQYAEDQSRLFLTDDTNHLYCFDENNALLWEKETERAVPSIRLTKDGQKLLLVQNVDLFLLDATDGSEIYRLRTEGEPIQRILISPDQQYIVYSSDWASLSVRSLETGELIKTIKLVDSTSEFEKVLFQLSTSGKNLNIAIGEEILVFSFETLEIKDRLQLRDEYPQAKGFSYINNSILADYETKTQLIDLKTAMALEADLESYQVSRVDSHKETHRVALATIDQSLRLYENSELIGQLENIHNSFISDLQFTKDGSHIITSSIDGRIRIFRVDEERLVEVKEETVQPSGNIIASSLDQSHLLLEKDDRYTVLSTDNFEIQQEWTSPDFILSVIGLSYDGTEIVIPTMEGFRIVDLTGNRGDEVFESSEPVLIYSAEFSPDGKMILTIDMQATLRVFDRETKQILYYEMMPFDSVDRFFFDSDTESLYVCSTAENRTLRIHWNNREKEEITGVVLDVERANGKSILRGVSNKDAFQIDGENVRTQWYLNEERIGYTREDFTFNLLNRENDLLITAVENVGIFLTDFSSGVTIQRLDLHPRSKPSAYFNQAGDRLIYARDIEDLISVPIYSYEQLIQMSREVLGNRSITEDELKEIGLFNEGIQE